MARPKAKRALERADLQCVRAVRSRCIYAAHRRTIRHDVLLASKRAPVAQVRVSTRRCLAAFPAARAWPPSNQMPIWQAPLHYLLSLRFPIFALLKSRSALLLQTPFDEVTGGIQNHDANVV